MIRKKVLVRRISACVLALGLCVAMLAGCGSSDQGAAGTGSGTATGGLTAENGADSGTAGSDAGTSDSGAAPGGSGRTVVEQTYFPELPTEKAQDPIYVQKIDGLSDDFIRGMDISSLLVEEDSGVKYYDAEGNEADLFKLLADAGINCIRVRVWVDPFDSEGRGYGGGNCTAETAAALGARAAAYGMNTCVDFHYSDFWADPNKQMCPKAWEGMNLTDKKQALYDYTCDSLRTIINAGARVTMVQVGNETNHGVAGETAFGDMAELFKNGIRAVNDISDEFGTDILTVVHFTSVDDSEWMKGIAEKLAKYKVEYDVFGISYYPYWHSTMTNMVNVLKYISDTYNVKTCIMETAYMYTGDDGDGSGNSVSGPDAVEGYPVSVQGQAKLVRDVCAAADEAGALGVFYWEGAWLPVKPESGTASTVWEEKGSGWASSYASDYDPDDAGIYYGGCSWENQAFFDFDGKALPSLDVFKYIYCGAEGEVNDILWYEETIEVNINPGGEVSLPETIDCVWADPECTSGMKVTWDEDAVAAIDTDEVGEYTVPGSVELAGSGVAGDPSDIKLNDDGTLYVEALVNVANVNLVADPSFEEEDHLAWVITDNAGNAPVDYQKKASDAHTGEVALHFWSKSDMDFTIEQEITPGQAGKYSAEAFMQGGDFDASSTIELYVKAGDTEYTSDPVTLDGWVNWKNPRIEGIEVGADDTVTIGARVKCNALAWATFDDFSLNLQ